MDDLTINKDEVGEEYLKELIEIIKIRADRKKVYGNSFLSEKPEALLVMIEGKIRRFQSSSDLENKRDSIRDLINYAIFVLCVLDKK